MQLAIPSPGGHTEPDQMARVHVEDTAQGNRGLRREHALLPRQLGMHRGDVRIQKREVWKKTGGDTFKPSGGFDHMTLK